MQLLLTHGASSDRNAPLLVALDRCLTQHGIRVIRYDLPYRQSRPHGPPRPNEAERDRAGLREALEDLRKDGAGPIWLGGHSYGGRQASMLVAEKPELVDGLLLCSYPLHPPGKPNQLRTAHLEKLERPVLFVHGSKDPFGSREEMEAAIRLIPARTVLLEIEKAGHDLGKDKNAIAEKIAEAFLSFAAAKQ
jgi:predicted alpha/beta-hydrolase family hydrolase